MIIATDVGNTNIVFGIMDNGNVVSDLIRTRTEKDATWAEYAIKIKDFLDILNVDINAIDGAIIGSVVPTVTESVSIALKKLTGNIPIIVSDKIKTNINIKIDDPSTIGADLLIGAVGAAEYYGLPSIVIDMGTATTITAVDEDRNFLGGSIMPGVKLGYNALSSGTSLLPGIAISAPDKCIGTNTIDCMRVGAVYGTAAMIDGMIDRMESEIGKCNVIATGGLASSIVDKCYRKIIIDDALLLKGLWKIYLMNK